MGQQEQHVGEGHPTALLVRDAGFVIYTCVDGSPLPDRGVVDVLQYLLQLVQVDAIDDPAGPGILRVIGWFAHRLDVGYTELGRVYTGLEHAT